jgi:hypothetical protein
MSCGSCACWHASGNNGVPCRKGVAPVVLSVEISALEAEVSSHYIELSVKHPRVS